MKANPNPYDTSYETDIHEMDFSTMPVHVFDDEHWFYIQQRFHLTDRELQVAQFVCHGLNNENIAAKLNIKPGTVKTHIRNLYRRIRTNNKIHMLLIFLSIYQKNADKSKKASVIPIFQRKNSPQNASTSTDLSRKK